MLSDSDEDDPFAEILFLRHRLGGALELIGGRFVEQLLRPDYDADAEASRSNNNNRRTF